MSFNIIPKNPDAGILGKPNGFWNALLVETPIATLVGAEYTSDGRVRHNHKGFDGDWFTKEEALEMHAILLAYIKTESYLNHRYFAARHNQMESLLMFLPVCDGFYREN